MEKQLIDDMTIQQIKTKQSHQRLLHIEILRIIAAFFVIFNHTGDYGYTLFQLYERSSIVYWLYLCFSVMCKVSVPMFFMISGALLLKKDEEARNKFVWRITRILIDLLVFSVLAYVQQIIQGNEVLNIARFFTVFLGSTWMSPYWYLYAYLGFLFTLPLLQKLAKALTDQNYRYMLILVLVVTGYVPLLLYIVSQGRLSINPDFNIAWISSQICFYPLLGYYIENRVSIYAISWKKILALWGVNLLSIGLSCYATDLQNMQTNGFPQTYMMLLAPINAMCLYMTFKKICAWTRSGLTSKIIAEIGICTFGIYLFHGLLLREPRISLYLRMEQHFHITRFPLTRVSLRCVEIMVIGGIITWLLKKIPWVKRLF